MNQTKSQGSGTLHVKQIRSGIGFDQTQKATLRALGLGRIGRVREHPDNAQVRGMVAKIPHLVTLVDKAASRAGREGKGEDR